MGNTLDLASLQEQEKQRIFNEINSPKINLQFNDKFFQKVITLSGTEMHQLVENKEISLSSLVDYFHKIKQKEQNYYQDLITVMYDTPKQRAQQLDEQYKNNESFPLAGFIFSIKDSLIFKDTMCSCGFAINCHNKYHYTEHQPVIQHLIDQGAIFLSKGNVPQALFSLESFNHVFGEARNPYDINRTPGGSSGGDAALVRLGLCNVALGSDIAGSLRIPALYCGIVTLKPTALRLPLGLLCNFFDNQKFAYKKDYGFNTMILPTAGPLTRTVEDCEKIMEIMTDGIEYDMFTPPLRWKRVKELPKKIGYLKQFDFLPVCQSQKRAMDITLNILKKKGVEIIEIDLNDIFEEMIMLNITGYFQVPILQSLFNGKVKEMQEPVVRDFDEIRLMAKLPTMLLPYVKKIYEKFGQKRKGVYIDAFVLSTQVNEMYVLDKRIEILTDIVSRLRKLDLESFIAHGMAIPATLHNNFQHTGINAVYTSIFNFLNFPVGVVPITLVKNDEQFYQDKYNDDYTKCFQKNMENSQGLPVGIQVCGLPWKDELVMKIMREIESEIKEDFRCKFQKDFFQQFIYKSYFQQNLLCYQQSFSVFKNNFNQNFIAFQLQINFIVIRQILIYVQYKFSILFFQWDRNIFKINLSLFKNQRNFNLNSICKYIRTKHWLFQLF